MQIALQHCVARRQYHIVYFWRRRRDAVALGSRIPIGNAIRIGVGRLSARGQRWIGTCVAIIEFGWRINDRAKLVQHAADDASIYSVAIKGRTSVTYDIYVRSTSICGCHLWQSDALTEKRHGSAPQLGRRGHSFV